MEEKKYLKWYNKLGYASGDIGSNFMYTFVSSFVLIFLTDAMGLEAGIIGMLILVSKIFDGITDLFFGSLIDRTKSKLGKARPWMLYAAFPLGISMILLFAMPNMGHTAQYVYFFIVYTLMNAFFYTANNIAYTSLISLITKNPTERVQISSIRLVCAYVAGIVVSSVTLGAVGALGGGANAWRTVAIIYTIILLVFNTISVFSVKELPEEKDDDGNDIEKQQLGLKDTFRYLLKNKYYLFLLGYNMVYFASTGIASGVSAYYFMYVIGNPALMGVFSLVGMATTLIGAFATPLLVKRFGIFKVALVGMISSAAFFVPYVYGSVVVSIPILIVTGFLKGLGAAPMMCMSNALTADVAEYTYLKEGVHLEGSIYSCGSVGVKVGNGIGSAICGILLSVGGYIGTAATQSASAISMIKFMFGGMGLILTVLMAVLLSKLNVQKANQQLMKSNEQ